MTVDNPNVGIAFALVSGAGAATAIGASVVFFPSLVKLASRRVLASSLGLSAGVMTYVSFVEILQKSKTSFLNAGHSADDAYVYSTLTFFAGVAIMMLLDIGVKILIGEKRHSHDPQKQQENGDNCLENNQVDEPQQLELSAPHCVGCSHDPIADLNEWVHNAEEEERTLKQRNSMDLTPTLGSLATSAAVSDDFDDNDQFDGKINAEDLSPLETENVKEALSSVEEATPKDKAEDVRTAYEQKKLIRMGLNTAVAIGLHNFPEGLATFVATLNDPTVGGVLAVAIGIHNIPEGLCVALPIYYATGNRKKAFLWAILSGISEPVAAVLGWAILANSFSDNMYAIMFGVVAGMMIIISLKELLPTAYRYDPEDTVVTLSVIAGMVIMALSLVLFVI